MTTCFLWRRLSQPLGGTTETYKPTATRGPAASQQCLGSGKFPWGHSLAWAPLRPAGASNSRLVGDGIFMGVSDDRTQARIPQDILFRARPQVQSCTWASSLPNVDRVTLAPGLRVLGSPGPPPSARLCQAPDTLCPLTPSPAA